MSASMEGHIETIQQLLDSGADVNLRGHDGGTALMLASEYGHINAVTTLINAGAHISLQDNDGRTAFEWAQENKNTEICKILEEAEHGSKNLNTVRLEAERAFISRSASNSCTDVPWANLNINAFLSSPQNALEIALSDKNIALAEQVLEQQSLSPWIVVNALEQYYDIARPLVIKNERFAKLLNMLEVREPKSSSAACNNCPVEAQKSLFLKDNASEDRQYQRQNKS